EAERHVLPGGELVAQLAEGAVCGARAIAIEGGRAEREPFDTHADLETPAREPLARELLDVWSELRKLARNANAHIEKAMVDPPHLDGELARAERALSHPEAGHAAHGSTVKEAEEKGKSSCATPGGASRRRAPASFERPAR